MDELKKDTTPPPPATSENKAPNNGTAGAVRDALNDTPQESMAAPSSSKKIPSGAVIKCSFAARCFEGLARVGLGTLLVFSLLQMLPDRLFMLTSDGVLQPQLFPWEQTFVDVYQTMLQNGQWLMLQLNGQPYTALPPLYFWFVAGVGALLHPLADCLPALMAALPPDVGNLLASWVRSPLSPALLLQAATVCSVLILVLVTWFLARATGNNRNTALAAGILLLTSLPFAGLARLVLPDFLFASCVLLSATCLYRGWIKPFAPLWLFAGFALAACATLIMGPLGIGLPVMTCLLFLLWRGTFRRAGALDGALGFGLMLTLIMGWVALLATTGNGRPYLAPLFSETFLPHLATLWNTIWNPSGQMEQWNTLVHFGIALAFLCLPWLVLLLFLPWERIHTLPVALWKNRTQNPGIGWLWCFLLASFALLPLTINPDAITWIPVLPVLAILGARVVLRLSPLRSRRCFGLLGLVFLLAGLAAAMIALYPIIQNHAPWLAALIAKTVPVCLLPWLTGLAGMSVLAGICLVFALTLLKLTDRSAPAGALLVTLIFATALVPPLTLYTLPSALKMTCPATLPEPIAPEPVAPEPVAPEPVAPEPVLPTPEALSVSENPTSTMSTPEAEKLPVSP